MIIYSYHPNCHHLDCLFRMIVDETLDIVQHVAFHKLKDAGAVASSVAASIYGLNILAEDIQVLTRAFNYHLLTHTF